MYECDANDKSEAAISSICCFTSHTEPLLRPVANLRACTLVSQAAAEESCWNVLIPIHRTQRLSQTPALRIQLKSFVLSVTASMAQNTMMSTPCQTDSHLIVCMPGAWFPVHIKLMSGE